MVNDRQITISAAGSRAADLWPAQRLLWSELVARLAAPVKGMETLEAYKRLKKSQQDQLKDVGGFVGGPLRDNRRKAANVLGRDVVTLDLDNIQPGQTDHVLRIIDGLGCSYCVYSTRKHAPEAPRLRVLIPLDHMATADEYEPIARKAAEMIGIQMADPTTFQAARLMYWPSCCADSQYIYTYADKGLLSVNGMLGLYADWRDVTQWPQVPGAPAPVRMAAKQEDPRAKQGLVGAFCRVYDIPAVIDAYLPGVYTPVDGASDRYTYAAGSTAGGAVVYNGGLYLYSHHATDPAGGQLLNSWDLARLHLYGEQDDGAKPGTPTHRLPSYQSMRQRAMADPTVAELVDQERYATAARDFEGLEDSSGGDAGSTAWMRQLTRDGMDVERTVQNVRVMLETDPRFAGRIRLDVYADAIIAQGPLPWPHRAKETQLFRWTDADDAGLRLYVEGVLKFRAREIIDDALALTAADHAYNPVVEYLQRQQWDGQPRLDTLFIDYLGAEDCAYTRAVTRKALVAAVARAYDPGVKYDTVPVLYGPQGVGKSTCIARMGMGWFSDNLYTFDGKDAAEQLQGAWIVELGEMEALSRSDLLVAKAFISRQVDSYRAAYARKTEQHPRRCVFFGTTNTHDYLKDPTGNRRWWPVDVAVCTPTKSVFDGLIPETVGQIWAEARAYYQMSEPLTLSAELEAEAEARRSGHTERDDLQGLIEEYLAKPLPDDWYRRTDLSWRLNYLTGAIQVEPEHLVPRDRVCAAEVWRECLMDRRSSPPAQESRRINRILENLPGWKRTDAPQRFGPYGWQRGFKRIRVYKTGEQTGKVLSLDPTLYTGDKDGRVQTCTEN
ncbi:MAG: VapE domain-containing protein [Christensenellales bacterium]|jgi:putative DNA primase/helicase